jgi:L-gulonate 3-dehydrogenase
MRQDRDVICEARQRGSLLKACLAMLGMRSIWNVKVRSFMPVVGIVGVGLVGRAWSNVFSRSGWEVRLFDSHPQTLEAAPERIRQSLHDLAQYGLVKDPDDAAGRISIAASLEEAVAGADLVQESGPERIGDKIAIYKQLDAAAGPETILASSSSAIVASRFSEDLAGRGRCLIAHPVNPPHVVPIVELCGAPWTEAKVIARAREIYDSVGQVSVEVKKEVDGFILNRMQAVLLAEAFRLVSEGYVTAADLDKTIAHGLGLRWSFMGPFETIELNAPGGLRDYCERFGPTMYSLSKLPVTEELWNEETIDKVAKSWGQSPKPDEIAKKSAWRDNRLAALVAHKREQKQYD